MANIAIIGGGAAGFFAAIAAKNKQPDADVVIFEKSEKVLAKVLMSGGGRCNLTNSFAEVKDLKNAYPRGDKMMKRLFKIFNNEDTFKWFEKNGVPLIVQEDECVFPRSQDAQSIASCLTQKAQKAGVRVLTSHKLERITPLEDGRIKLHFNNQKTYIYNKVCITTGGSPNINGLKYLADIGHKIEPPIPSLFTFDIPDKAFCDMMGTVVENATISIPSTKFKSTGALLITHWGISGPATLKLSSYAARHVSECGYRFKISINWINENNTAKVEEHISDIIRNNPRKQAANIRPYNIPNRLWHFILSKTSIPYDKKWEEIGKKGINKMIEMLTNDIFEVAGKGSFRDEFVTCGGVSLSSININTLESKHCPNLYFAGEVMDVDAITGGFNLQAAWTTGYIAGQNMAE